jgi:hypothetical protein
MTAKSVVAYVVIRRASINIFVRIKFQVSKMRQMKHISAPTMSISIGTKISLTTLPFVEPKFWHNHNLQTHSLEVRLI